MPPRPWRRPAVAAILLAAVLAWLAPRLPTPWVLVEPGIAVAVTVRATGAPAEEGAAGGTRAAPVPGTPAAGPAGAGPAAGREPAPPGREGSGGYWLVTVAARPARLGDAWSALWDPQRALWPRAVLGAGSLEEAARLQREALAASQEAAVAAASRWLGRPVPASLRFTVPPEVGGPSGGLAFALAAVDALAPGDLTGGLRVAATGTVTPDGRVGPVEGLVQKAVAARRAGMDVLFVPGGTGGQGGAVGIAPGPGGRPQVVAVTNLAQAVAWLCRHGGRGPACAGAGPAASRSGTPGAGR